MCDSKDSNSSLEFHKNSRNSNQTMGIKTSDSYQKEVLEKYKREKGGEMKGYLMEPTRRQIREACIDLLRKEHSKNDNYILNRFFQFRNEDDKLKAIQNFDADKFRPVVNFLKGKAQKTSPENIELIALLIDFQPRPLQEYLKSIYTPSSKEAIKDESGNNVDGSGIVTGENNVVTGKSNREENITSTPNWKLVMTITFAFVAILLVTIFFKNRISGHASSENFCMAWADSVYLEVSCNTKPYSKYGTKVEPLDKVRLENFKKVKVTMASTFFTEEANKPLLWYYKTKENEIEYFTAPGLHPTTGETLRKITPYIIQTYVPVHSNNEDSFIEH